MNFKLLLLAIATVSISSCSTTYKSGQTPDDIYFSPIRGIDEKDDVKKDDVRKNTNNRYVEYDERVMRMSAYDRRWRDLDDYYDYSYRYDPYHYGYNYGYYYNPYYYKTPIYLPGYAVVNPKNTTPRMTNLGSYNNSKLQVTNDKSGQTKWIRLNNSYNNTNKSETFLRKIITSPSYNNSSSGSTRNSGYESNNNTRTYSPSSSSSSSSSSSGSSSSSSSSSSGGSVSRPARGN